MKIVDYIGSDLGYTKKGRCLESAGLVGVLCLWSFKIHYISVQDTEDFKFMEKNFCHAYQITTSRIWATRKADSKEYSR